VTLLLIYRESVDREWQVIGTRDPSDRMPSALTAGEYALIDLERIPAQVVVTAQDAARRAARAWVKQARERLGLPVLDDA
jgi:hypothetical protein